MIQGFVNNVDPITLEEYNVIGSTENVIILTVGNKTRFYNVRSLYEWVKINPVDPTTKVIFLVHHMRKIYKNSLEPYIYKCIKDC